MEEQVFNSCSLEQELAEKASELKAQRTMREEQLVDITLEAIAHRVESKETEIIGVMTASKGQGNGVLREIVAREIIRSANGMLWCRHYDAKMKANQLISIFVGTHWETVETQQWMDFVDVCAARCGLPEAQRMNHSAMNTLYENVAFNLKGYHRQPIPKDEVWLNVSNGTLELHADGTVGLREHRKEDLFTYVLPYPYDPLAECPQWHRFLDRVLPETEAQQVLAEFAGYCMSSGHALEKMLMLYGEGLNGKSVTLEVFEGLLGHVNVSYLSLSDLTNDDVKRAAIEGKKLNISHESGKDVNPNVLKQLTSGEPVLVKHLYYDPYVISHYGKLIAAFNILPRAENTFGFFRRVIILPYEVTIPQEEIDRQLATKLKAELPGILNWVLEATAGLMTRGDFTKSDCCEKALERYRLQSDSIRLFLSEMCETTEASGFTTPAAELYTAYRNYCFSASLKAVGKNKFIARLETLGHTPKVTGNVKYFYLKTIEQ